MPPTLPLVVLKCFIRPYSSTIFLTATVTNLGPPDPRVLVLSIVLFVLGTDLNASISCTASSNQLACNQIDLLALVSDRCRRRRRRRVRPRRRARGASTSGGGAFPASCAFAADFPPEHGDQFAAVHNVFGASNVSKLLAEVAPEDRAGAVESLVYEARASLRDPAFGCVSYITVLEHMLKQRVDGGEAGGERAAGRRAAVR
ncbi:hypothetical protein EJB05_15003, partial [Eragrostis curvula]